MSFIPPRNFAEFYRRYPDWVRKMAVKLSHSRYFCERAAELEQDLLLFLLNGKIEQFNADLYDNLTAGIFFAWLKLILTNCARTRHTRHERDALAAETVTIIPHIRDEYVPGEFDESALADYVVRRGISEDQRVYLNEFRRYLERESPDLLPVLNTIAEGTAMKYTMMTRLRKHADNFKRRRRKRMRRRNTDGLTKSTGVG